MPPPTTFRLRCGVTDSFNTFRTTAAVAARLQARGVGDPGRGFRPHPAHSFRFTIGRRFNARNPITLYKCRGVGGATALTQEELTVITTRLEALIQETALADAHVAATDSPNDALLRAHLATVYQGISAMIDDELSGLVVPNPVPVPPQPQRAAVPTTARYLKQCFEFRDGPRHQKFWTVEKVGVSAFVTYGKIGTRGTTQVRALESTQAVETFASKMIREKINKGYVPVPSDAHPGAPERMIALAAGGQATPVQAAARAAPPATNPADGDRFLDL